MDVVGCQIIYNDNTLVIMEWAEAGLIEHENPYHKEGTIGTHVNMVVAEVKKHNHSNELLLAAMFHDIGKVVVKEYNEEKGYYTYHSHEKYSEEMFRDIYYQYNLDKQSEGIDLEHICFLIRNHHKIDNIDIYRKHKRRKKAIELLESPYLNDLITLRNCDGLGRIPQRKEMIEWM